MQETYDFINQKIEANNFRFPQIRRFIFDNKAFEQKNKQHFILFQNNNTTLSESFYLEQKIVGGKAFNIVKEKNNNTISTYEFFGMIKSATEQLLRTFDSVRDKDYAMQAIIRQMWDTKNDNTKGEYNRYISENYTYRIRKIKK